MPAVAAVRRGFSSAVEQARRGEPVRITKHGRPIAALIDIDTLRLIEQAEASVVGKKIAGGRLSFVTANDIWDLI
jgi:prevent-host-death family protein